MTKSSTKRALLMSLLSMLVCLTMLVGSTFAWFTDEASTSVSSIKSGTLDIELMMKNAAGDWVTAEGQTIGWKTADNRAQENILWEPGATYELQELKLVNNSSLALKYKVEITGINGDAELNDVIDWTVQLDGKALNAGEEMVWLPEDADEKVFTISGHMREDATNDYQDLSIEGVGITVYATQHTYEKDSYSDQYDANAWSDMQFAQTAKKVSTENELLAALKPTAPGEKIEVMLESSINTDNNGDEYWGTPAVELSDNTTLNLNGNSISITGNGKNGLAPAAGATATVSNGTISIDNVNGTSWGAVNVKEGAVLTMVSMTISGPEGNGSVIVVNRSSTPHTGGKLILRNCTVNGNILVGSSAELILENCTINGSISVMVSGKMTATGSSYADGSEVKNIIK